MALQSTFLPGQFIVLYKVPEKLFAQFLTAIPSFPSYLGMMKSYSLDLENVTDATLAHYNNRAEDFWQGTRDHDVSQNINTLLQHIDGQAPFTILDFGCGPGRDLKAFVELGHAVIGLDGSSQFAAMARERGFEVWEQDFLKLDLPNVSFDGIFANASLFHVPSQELPRVLMELSATLKPGGVLFSSNPAETIRKAGTMVATVLSMTWKLGEALCWARDFRSCRTIIGLRDCRARSRTGSQASGVSLT